MKTFLILLLACTASLMAFNSSPQYNGPILQGSDNGIDTIEWKRVHKELYDQVWALLAKERTISDNMEKEEIREQLEDLTERINAMNLEFMQSYPESNMSVLLMRSAIALLDCKTAETIYNSFTENAKNSAFGKEIFAKLEKRRISEPGQKAKLFVKTDINGEELNLPELNKDHYILLDFWASWCEPCRRGNPHLKELYKKYGPKGLLIVCVADDDRRQDDWKMAIETDGTEEFRHVLNGIKYTGSGSDRVIDLSEALSEDFGTLVLPTKFLIDKNGIIVLNCTSDTKALDAKLKEIFGE